MCNCTLLYFKWSMVFANVHFSLHHQFITEIKGGVSLYVIVSLKIRTSKLKRTFIFWQWHCNSVCSQKIKLVMQYPCFPLCKENIFLVIGKNRMLLMLICKIWTSSCHYALSSVIVVISIIIPAQEGAHWLTTEKIIKIKKNSVHFPTYNSHYMFGIIHDFLNRMWCDGVILLRRCWLPVTKISGIGITWQGISPLFA